ncbi:MAG TPA: nicotinate-nucleotide adenylyltransferase [Clostridiaceae bacterium]|nr:nicotinate-nucleotide adenylyltransferase [Clostridiaceae bacterium]
MLGIMGGTFNPIHYGHLLMCEGIREEFSLERIIFIPAKIPPHKDNSKIIGAHDRFRMVELAISDNPFFMASEIEIKRKGSSYTVDTLRTVKEQTNNKEISIIVGADSLIQFETWKDYREIFKLAVIIVASRPDTEEDILISYINKFKKEFGADILKYSGKAMDYSSTEIRRRVEMGLSIKYQVPPVVERYIYKNRLYRNA